MTHGPVTDLPRSELKLRPVLPRLTRQISKQGAVFLLGALFAAVTGYGLNLYLGRILGPRPLGLFALGMSVVQFLALIARLGQPQTAARFVAIYRGRHDAAEIGRLLVQGILLLASSSGLAVLVLLAIGEWVSVEFFEEPELLAYLPIFAAVLVLTPFHSFLADYLRGHQEVVRRTVVVQFIQLPSKIFLTLVLVSLGLGLSGYLFAELASLALGVALLVRSALQSTPKIEKPLFRWNPNTAVRAHFGLSMTGIGVLSYAANATSNLLVGTFLEASYVGVFAMAMATSVFVSMPLEALASIFGPISADLIARHQTAVLAELFRQSTRWCLLVVGPIALVAVVFARPIMGFFGPEFELGASAFAVLAFGRLLGTTVGPVGVLLVMGGQQRLEVLSSAAAATASIGLGLLWIPSFGLWGAGLSTMVGIAIANLVRLWGVHRVLGIKPYKLQDWRLLIPLAAAGLSSWGLRAQGIVSSSTPWWWVLAACAGLYLLSWLLALFFALEAWERRSLGNLLSQGLARLKHRSSARL